MGETEQGVPKAGPKTQRLGVVGGGGLGLALRPQQVGEIEVGLGIVRPVRERLPVVSGGEIGPALRLADQGEVDVGLGKGGLPFDRPQHEAGRLVEPPGLGSRQPREMQRRRMLRLASENLPVKRLGLGEPAGAMMADGGGEQRPRIRRARRVSRVHGNR